MASLAANTALILVALMHMPDHDATAPSMWVEQSVSLLEI